MKSESAPGKPSYRPPDVQEHLVRANAIPQTYSIRVMQPMRRADELERFPVLYVTDSDDLFDGLAAMARSLQLSGEVPRFFMVGIGYGDPAVAQILRWRDLATRYIRARLMSELRQLAQSPLVGGGVDVDAAMATTDAADFLQFLCAELMPFIDSKYPVLADQSGFFGYSAGGTFGLYSLFSRPEAFSFYIIGSPGTSYDGHHFGIEMAHASLHSTRTLAARVFISVGELEEFKAGFEKFELTSGYYQMVKHLRQWRPSLDLTARVFSGETHASAWTCAFTHGLKALLPSPEPLPFWPDYMRRS